MTIVETSEPSAWVSAGTSTMNPEVKALWTEALRSGEYEQGVGYLHLGDKFCCLGVLANVAIKAGLDIKVEAESASISEELSYVKYDGDGQILGDNLQDWAGLSSCNPVMWDQPFDGDAEDDTLAGLNDAGFTFDTIADLIDLNL